MMEDLLARLILSSAKTVILPALPLPEITLAKKLPSSKENDPTAISILPPSPIPKLEVVITLLVSVIDKEPA